MRTTFVTVLSLCVAVSAAPSLADVQVGQTSQLSLSMSGGAPAGPSSDPAVAANGRYVTFTSRAGDIVPGDGTSSSDVFLRDLKTGTVSRVSVNTAGEAADLDSYKSAVSSILTGGKFAIAFESNAMNLGTYSGLPSGSHIFLRIPSLGITEVLTAPTFTSGVPGSNSDPSIAVSLDSKGDVVARVVYVSEAANLIEGDTNGQADIYLTEFKFPKSASYDRAAQIVTMGRISQQSDLGPEPDEASDSPKISGDGESVVFASRASNLINGTYISPELKQIYVVNRTTRTVTLVSKDADGNPADGNCFSPAISFNGRYITYLTDAGNIVTPVGAENYTLVRYDTKTGVSERVNETKDGVGGNGSPSSAALLANGRIVVFADSASNLVPDDTNSNADVFIKDMETGDVTRVSVGPGGAQPDSFSDTPLITASTFSSLNLTAVYFSYAMNLTSPSTATQIGDIFSTNITLDPPPLSPSASIDVPPDVKVNSKNITLTCQKFSLSQNQANAAGRRLAVRYQFDIVRKVKSKGRTTTTRMNLKSKRNKITLSKIRGTYTVRSRVLAVKPSTGRVQFRIDYSPRQRFTAS